MFLDARHEARDEVELTFADNGGLGIEQSAFGFVETEEDLALGKYWSLRRVDIFGGFLIARKDATAEADDPPLLVANWKDQPATKAIIVILRAFLA